MIKRPFLIFVAVMTLLIGGVISYLQSAAFAGLAKQVLARYMPKDSGIEADFAEFKVKIFPPGISLVSPRIRVIGQNVAGLPAGSSLVAERLDLAFRPVQMFSGNIRVHEVTLAGGDVTLVLGDLLSGKKKKKKLELRWNELAQLQAEAISIIDTKIRVESTDPSLSGELTARRARVGQWYGPGGMGYEVDADLHDITYKSGLLKGVPLPPLVSHVGVTAHVNRAGLQAERVELEVPGGQFAARGSITGDLLGTKPALKFAAQTSVRGEIAKLAESLITDAKLRAKVAPEGALELDAKVSGTLDHPLESLRADATLALKDVKFAKWGADALKTELTWTGTSRVGVWGDLAVNKVQLSAREREKSGGFQSGDGGKAEVGAFKMALGPSGPSAFTAPLKLDRAHVHWLAKGVLKQIYPLSLRATGPIELSYKPPSDGKSWLLEGNAGLDIDHLQLDNQKLGLNKPLHKIIRIPKIRVDAGIMVDRTAFFVTEATVSSGETTSFQGSGKVDFKTGFDLEFSGTANLKDVGQIAENDIRGQGDLDVRIHGPLSAPILDFDPVVRDAYYLHLKLGEVRGRITWDDEPNKLIFTKILASRGRTSYTADGVVDLDKDKDTIDISVRVPIGDIQDMTHVFDDLTSDLWWFPRELSGPVHGDVHIGGGIRMDRLIVSARVSGTDWQQWGERLATVRMQGGYDRGKYHVSDFNAVKRTGRILGRISFDADQVMDWGIHTEALTISDLDHVAQLDVPMRGKLTIESAGKGKQGAIQSTTVARLEEFAVRGAPLPPSDLLLKTESGKAEVHGAALGGQGRLDGVYDFVMGGKSWLKSELKRLDFSPVVLMLNPKLIQDRALQGIASGSVNLTFNSGRIERASGKVELSEYVLAKSGTRFELAKPVSIAVSDGSFDIRDLTLKDEGAEATLTMHSEQSEIEGAISGEIDSSIIELLTPAVAEADGAATLDFALGGRIKEPTIFGKATFEGASVKVRAMDSAFENCSGTLQLRQNVVSIQNVQADLAGGRVTAEGAVQLFADRYPQIDIKSELLGSKIKAYPFQFLKVHGSVDVHGDKLPYQVDGDIRIESALSTEKVFGQRNAQGLKALQYTPPPSKVGVADYPLFKLNIKAAAESGVMIRNDLFDFEAKGNLRLINTLETPRMLGTADIIGGKIIFKDRSFQIQSASATFDNPTVLNPAFTLTAGTEVGGTKIQMYAHGRLPDNWKVELSSNPVMPEPEIISLLALGVTSSDAKKFNASDRAVLEQGEAASLLLNSLDFNRDMQAKTGLQIGVDESTAPQQAGTSIFKPQTGADSLAQPRIVIKRKIGSRLELSYGQTVGSTASTNAKSGTAEVLVSPGFSLMGVWDNYGTSDTKERNSVGGDLKFQWRFK